ncbi:MAG: hypothetical protein KBS52_04995 [Clostridiales bacterium]|nr:hypothetical protein [Candidatus Equinaster intestinalis]
MENINAWEKFRASGKIEDYLSYKNIKLGEKKDADNRPSIGDKGNRYR